MFVMVFGQKHTPNCALGCIKLMASPAATNVWPRCGQVCG